MRKIFIRGYKPVIAFLLVGILLFSYQNCGGGFSSINPSLTNSSLAIDPATGLPATPAATPVSIASPNPKPTPFMSAEGISAGERHTCAIKAGGTVQCWGSNSSGQLGNNTKIDSSVPVDVMNLKNVTLISAGLRHTCALVAGGTAWCWGLNVYGQLGNGTTADSSVPILVAGLTGAISVVAGDFHSCAIVSNGSVQCWGSGAFGSVLVKASAPATSPMALAGLSGAVSSISTTVGAQGSYDHSCGIFSGGVVQCWGDNFSGELGNGSTVLTSPPVQVQGLSSVVAISAGGSSGFQITPGNNNQFTCAVKSAGTVHCWGDNFRGQIGNGSTSNSSVPVEATGVNGATAISTGYLHSCALVAAGKVRCWGANSNGQLGNGTLTDSLTAVDVTVLTGATAISGRWNHNCARVAGGAVQCWGWNSNGQLGNGTKLDSNVPVAAQFTP